MVRGQAKALEDKAKAKIEQEEAKAATLRLCQQNEANAAAASANRLHTTVAKLLKRLDLQHYADKFAAANIDDARLNEIIDIVRVPNSTLLGTRCPHSAHVCVTDTRTYA